MRISDNVSMLYVNNDLVYLILMCIQNEWCEYVYKWQCENVNILQCAFMYLWEFENLNETCDNDLVY